MTPQNFANAAFSAFTAMQREKLVEVIRSAPGPWQGREIENKDRETLERLAHLARTVQSRLTTA